MTEAQELRDLAYRMARILTPNGGLERPATYLDICNFVGVTP